MAGIRQHKGSRWRRVRTIVLSPDPLYCAVPRCLNGNRYINKRLPYRHRFSMTVDLIVPLSLGGSPYDPLNLRPAHYACNSARGNGTKQRNVSESIRNYISDDEF